MSEKMPHFRQHMFCYYFTAFQILPMHFALPNQYAFNYLLMLYHNTFLKLYSYISEYMLSWSWGVSLLSNAAISTVKPLSATEKAPLLN